mmetsp:Transcript_131587/g.227949  ORF Transcript_131587/g.227949 Transcript_131587/m.227949 type:complete len:87 (+) Transcript_131587:1441-1701(+)
MQSVSQHNKRTASCPAGLLTLSSIVCKLTGTGLTRVDKHTQQYHLNSRCVWAKLVAANILQSKGHGKPACKCSSEMVLWDCGILHI